MHIFFTFCEFLSILILFILVICFSREWHEIASQSRNGSRDMLNLAQKYVKDHNISFSTSPNPTRSKTKDMIFSQAKLIFSPAEYIKKNNELMQKFLQHHEFLCNLNRVYNNSFPGSLLHGFSSNACKQLVNNWSVFMEQCGTCLSMLTAT